MSVTFDLSGECDPAVPLAIATSLFHESLLFIAGGKDGTHGSQIIYPFEYNIVNFIFKFILL